MSWSLTEILDIHWSEINLDAMTPADAYVVESAMLVESNAPEYVANLLEYFKADQDVCDFIAMWTIEEWKHYYGLRDYVAKVRTGLPPRRASCLTDSLDDAARIAGDRREIKRALTDEIAGVREASSRNWGIPPHYSCPQVVANTTLQEFVDRGLLPQSRRADEGARPRAIESLLAKDETRHEMFYEEQAQRLPRARPGLCLPSSPRSRSSACRAPTCSTTTKSARPAMEAAAFPSMAENKAAFVRLFGKMDASWATTRHARLHRGPLPVRWPPRRSKKMRPEIIARLITRKLVA